MLLKRGLERRRNDEVNEEPWVHCDTCDRSVTLRDSYVQFKSG